jgi:hypothetical protein
MAKQKLSRGPALRERIAQEAARILVESGSRNYLQAKRKAAHRLGVSGSRNLPANQEVERALAEYQRLFQSDTQPEELRQLRLVALEAMRMLDDLSPRLVGPVLEGTADRYSEVNLHLFADAAEDVARFLFDRGIPCEIAERRLRDARGNLVQQPEYRFLAGDVPVGLTVFSGPSSRHAPLSPVDGKPMRRADRGQVEALVAAAEAAPASPVHGA